MCLLCFLLGVLFVLLLRLLLGIRLDDHVVVDTDKLGMCKLTHSSLWTETRHVKLAGHASDVFSRALGAHLTEALFVVEADRDLGSRIDMEVLTVGRLRAEAVLHVELALGHLLQVVLVQELAVEPLFAQASQPMFAHNLVEKRGCQMFVRARVASRTAVKLEKSST